LKFKPDTIVTSFNVENGRNNSHYVIKDLKDSDILLLQETWLFQCEIQAGILKKIYTEYDSYARGVDIDNPIPPTSIPRGYGGIAILWKKELTPIVSKKSNGNNRIICIEIKNCYIINVYFPSGNDRTSVEAHLECMDILESIVQSIPIDKHILIAGDWNIDIFKLKYRKDERRKKLIKFMKEYNLMCLSSNLKPTYTDNRGYTSHIDLFLTRNSSTKCSDQFQATLHERVPWNSSTHIPISLKINMSIPLRPKAKHIVVKKMKINWSTLNKQKYDETIQHGMQNINPKIDQSAMLTKYNDLLQSAVKSSADTKIVRNIPAIKKPWNKEIAEAVADAKKVFYELKGDRNDSKDTAETEEIIKIKRKAVRSAHRRFFAKSKINLLSELTEASIQKNAKDVSQIIKRINGSSNDVSPLDIDGETIYDLGTCTEKWAQYYEKLSSPDEKNASMNNEYLETIKESVKIIRKTFAIVKDPLPRKINRKDITNAIRKLNCGKAPDELGLVSEYLKYSDVVPDLLQMLVQKVVDEENVNKCLKTSLKNSIPKKDKNKMLQDHYRGIAITLLFMKIIEHVLLEFSELEANTHKMQYGFTKGRSPDMAALCLTESIIEAEENLSNIIIVSLDTKKAFDLVHHDILRYKLYHKNIHPRLWKIFDSLLKHQTERAKWGGHISKPYTIGQGTGQGKVLGAPFYKVFIEDVLVNLSNLGLGFHIGDIPMNSPTCADDLLIISESSLEAQIMCQSVEITSKNDRSTQQPDKSRISTDKETIIMNGDIIPHKPSYTHIGIERYTEGYNQLVTDRISTANKTIYGLIPCGLHGNGLSPSTTKGLVEPYVNPRLINGLHTLVLTQTQREKILRAQLKFIKNLQCLRMQTATSISFLIFGALPILADLDIRIIGLFGAICRMEEGQPLRKVAIRQLSVKSYQSKSWFIQTKKIAETYGINVESALILNWSKDEWSEYTKNAIKSFWFNKLRLEAASQSSLKYLNMNLIQPNTPHPVWPKTHIQWLITCAAYRAKMLCGSYILQSNTSQFNQYKVDATCKLCMNGNEDMIHFILKCRKLKKARKPYMRKIRKFILDNETAICNEIDLLILILNGVENNDQQSTDFNNTCSILCYKLHKERMEKLEDIEPKKKKKKKRKIIENPDPNACIHCNKVVKDNDEALACDSCERWQHIRCQKIVGVRKYRRICEAAEPPIKWICKFCKH